MIMAVIEFFFILTVIGTFVSLVVSQALWNKKNKK